jgi:ABC-type lipoprotein export system ATPase subunit
MLTDPRGSLWRVWDFHVHTPASFHWNGEKFGDNQNRNTELVDEMISALNKAEPAVFAFMDYWTFDGWFALKKRLEENGAPKLTKTVFPGIELRLAAPIRGRLNAHVVFSNKVTDQTLRDFLSRLKLELTDQILSKEALINYARHVGEEKLAGHGYKLSEVISDDAKALSAGYEIAELKSDSYKEAIKLAPEDEAVGFMPFDTNDGLADIDRNKHYAYTLSLFEKSPIFETRKNDLWAAFVGIETNGNRAWFPQFQAALKNKPRLAVSGSDAHRFFGETGNNDKRGYGDFPSGRKTWIKADPTWHGLLQVLKEPAKRSFIGELPQKLQQISHAQTFYIDRISIKKVTGSKLEDAWLDGVELPLNPDLVAIIGNKGSGKSALADIIALLGSSQQGEHFSFLKSNRFRGKNGDPARQFVGTMHWLSGEPNQSNLSIDPAPDKVELVKYIPQGRFEALCNEHVAGRSQAFEAELRSVIFSHVEPEVRLDSLNFDQLIETLEKVFRARLNELRKQLKMLNEQVLALEDQLHPIKRKNIAEQFKLKEREYLQLKSTPPVEIAAPAEHLTELQAKVTDKISEIGVEIAEIETHKANISAQRIEISRKQRSLKNIEDNLALIESQLNSFVESTAPDFASLGILIEQVIKVDVHKSILAKRQDDLSATEQSLVAGLLEIESRVSALVEEKDGLALELNEPQLRYQNYLAEHKIWLENLALLEGSETEPESIKGLAARLAQIDKLPEDLVAKKSERASFTRRIYEVLAEQREARASLFRPLQVLIQANKLIRDDYKLQFQANLQGSAQAIADHLFDYVKRNAGELRGDTESYEAVRKRFEAYSIQNADHAVAFADSMSQLFSSVSNQIEQNVPGIRAIMRKEKQPTDVYDYLYGLEYLEPKYTLLFQDTQIEQLSPGQRGALLLIFYLLVDKGRNPIVLDQPEENLDNETVVKLLVPVLNEAKKSRQIFMVTHNPNLAVVCDAEQIIYAQFDRKNGAKITYSAASIENSQMNRTVVDVLEGTKFAFENRSEKYH